MPLFDHACTDLLINYHNNEEINILLKLFVMLINLMALQLLKSIVFIKKSFPYFKIIMEEVIVIKLYFNGFCYN